MTLKEKFISFCELQKAANLERSLKGHEDRDTIEAYERANKLKREILEGLDENSNH
jgi:hypothetical protein